MRTIRRLPTAASVFGAALLTACAMAPPEPEPVTAARVACVASWVELPAPSSTPPTVRTASLLTIRAMFAEAHGPGGTEQARVREVGALYLPAEGVIYVPGEALDRVDLEHAELAKWIGHRAGVPEREWTDLATRAERRSRTDYPAHC